jgi:hypothetical protein
MIGRDRLDQMWPTEPGDNARGESDPAVSAERAKAQHAAAMEAFEALRTAAHGWGNLAGRISQSALAAREQGTIRALDITTTHLIAARREVLTSRQQLEWAEQRVRHLESANAKQMDTIDSLVNTSDALQSVFGAAGRGTICMHQSHTGVVTRVIDDEVVVRYDSPDGPLEQVYDRSQFSKGQVPAEGDAVEARVFMWHRPHMSRGVEDLVTPKEAEAMRQSGGRRPNGPVEF